MEVLREGRGRRRPGRTRARTRYPCASAGAGQVDRQLSFLSLSLTNNHRGIFAGTAEQIGPFLTVTALPPGPTEMVMATAAQRSVSPAAQSAWCHRPPTAPPRAPRDVAASAPTAR